ncbi:hypothetical protein, partial [Thomasclavelia ramosa]|uniref:hypothetical protein n=1 Tax=Thomasclavelia ramosa TaxID=1547 RepID=UPI00233F512B
SYLASCHPDGFIIPIEPLFSVGINSLHIFAYATPQRPNSSKSVYSSKASVRFLSSSLNSALFPLTST